MSQVQKIIKYCAIGFALFLVVNIVGGIFFGLAAVGSFFDRNEQKVSMNDLEVLKIEQGNYNELDIDVASSSIVIKEGDTFKVETNNKYIRVSSEENILEIEEKEHFINNTENTVVIYIPVDYSFNEVSIDGGAGKVEVEKLTTKDISLDLGAGKVEFDSLIVTGDADIDGGAGAMEINSGVINNLDLDMGVGKVTMKVKLTGNNDIDAGVGELDVRLEGTDTEYMIRVNKGIGEAKINGKSVSNNTTYGTGSNKVLIDGGVGNIIIDFSE